MHIGQLVLLGKNMMLFQLKTPAAFFCGSKASLLKENETCGNPLERRTSTHWKHLQIIQPNLEVLADAPLVSVVEYGFCKTRFSLGRRVEPGWEIRLHCWSALL